MANNALGYSFAPTFDNAQQGQSGGVSSPQGALQTLNFRLPPRVSNSPSPLLTDQRRSTFGGSVLQSVLRTVLGSDMATFGDMGGGSSVGPQGGGDMGAEVLRLLSGGGGYPGGASGRPSPGFILGDPEPGAAVPGNDIIPFVTFRTSASPYEYGDTPTGDLSNDIVRLYQPQAPRYNDGPMAGAVDRQRTDY